MDKSKTLSYFTSPLLSKHGVPHGFFTRQANEHIVYENPPSKKYMDSAVDNRKSWLRAIDIDDHGFVFMECANQDKILDLGKNSPFNITLSDNDAVLTNSDQIALAFTVADCVPIFLFEPGQRIIGIVHAGWKGTNGGIAKRTIEMMIENYKIAPKNVIAAIGPAICGKCYEVKNDVGDLFAKKYKNINNGKIYLDLVRANIDQLKKAGVKQIDRIDICTFENTHLFYSYRKENTPKRFAAVIG
ncbi:peptidoglycan editing factor PgeF [Candidatus Saccharibacteria bacterium CPR2]|nr:peptidoglycan editing factor PgeF [Candidatus Saccharibacteria bacterium CPR2]